MSVYNLLARARAFISDRRVAYVQCLHPDRGVAAQAVLRDLAKFCRAHESTAHSDPNMAARLDGRREVWLRISQHLQLDERTLWLLFEPKVNQ